jgi:hypothetical protein
MTEFSHAARRRQLDYVVRSHFLRQFFVPSGLWVEPKDAQFLLAAAGLR